MNLDRIQELKAKYRHHGLDDEEGAELEQLQDQLRQVQLASYPYPTCCKEAERYRTVYFLVVDETRSHWVSKFIDIDGDPNVRDTAWYEGIPEARFCTLCGAPLPKMVLKRDPPRPLSKSDKYYCLTCDERLDGCTCYPPEAAYEPA